MRIALIHALRHSVAPVAEAFARLWPEAMLANLLDDSLSADLAAAGELTPAMTGRFLTLARYAADGGARGILFTCSAFGPAIERVAQSVAVPVLKPNEAMFAEAIAIGGTVGMLATFEPSIASMGVEFKEDAAKAGLNVTLQTKFVPDAMAALLAGDRDKHDALVAEAGTALAHCNAIMLAQFSMAPAADLLRQKVPGTPVLTSPGAAVAAMRRRIS
jgi:Asp/Glu/hydantoin racemase